MREELIKVSDPHYMRHDGHYVRDGVGWGSSPVKTPSTRY